MLLLNQKRPEDSSTEKDFQMGQMLYSSGSSKTYESNFRVFSLTLLFLVLFSSGSWVKLVGAISSTESPLNLNVNLGNVRESFSTPLPNGGDEPRESERDVFPSSGVTDYPTPFESKFTSNGQFVKSTLTERKTTLTTTPHPLLDESEKLAAAAESVVVVEKKKANIFVLSSSKGVVSSTKPTLSSPGTLVLQSESPLLLSTVVSIKSDDGKDSNSNPVVHGELLTTSKVGKSSSSESQEEEAAAVSVSPTLFQYPTYYSSEETKEKPSNINLLRKLWSSTRSSKLNLTHEHQSLLRIESEKSNSSAASGGGGSGKESTSSSSSSSGSRSLADLLEIRESSSFPSWIPTSTPSSISSSVPFSLELTSLRPTSLKLGKELDRTAATFIQTTGNHHHPSPPHSSSTSEISDAPEVPEVHSIKELQPSFNDGTELSTSIPQVLQRDSKTPKARIRVGDNSFPKPSSFTNRRNPPMLYPEWLSSGGVYPDDSSTNGTGEYYGEPEYENLINSNENNGGSPSTLQGGNPGEREEEAPGRRMQFRKRINTEFLERVANQSWQNRLRLREQQVLREAERENRIAASLAAVSAEANAMSTEAPEAIIAQNGLADVISRGRIDSVMYVYFGDKYNDYHKEEIAGRIIQAIGGVIAAIAQVLTVLGAAKCVRKSSQSNQPPVHLHIGFALLISNLLLLLAVHATEPADVCATVAMILHYLHLVIGCWLFAHTVRTYLKLRRYAEAQNLVSSDSDDRPREIKRSICSSSLRYCFAAWSAPLPFIIMSYLANPDGYETRHYCWMSIEKGMVVSFIVPVFLLIGLNTFLVVLSLRHLLAQRKLWADSSSAEMDEDSLDERKISSGIRASAMLLPLLAIMWFLGVVAKENASSIFFQIAGASANIALSWLVLYFLGDETWPELWCLLSKRDRSNSTFSIEDSCSGPSSVQPGAHFSFDNEPLLAVSSMAAVLPVPSTSSALLAATQEIGPSGSSNFQHKPAATVKIPVFPGPSRSGKRQHKSSKKPNWSTPGGNEIYELKLDSISTICK